MTVSGGADTIGSEPGPGGPPPRRTLRGRALAGAAVVVVGLAAGATGVAMAADSSTPSPSPSATEDGTPGYGGPGSNGNGKGYGRMGLGRGHGMGGPGMGAGMGMGHAGPGLHGEFVVPRTGGGYQTLHTQRGTVTAVSKSSITVKSEDGFSETYDVTADTLVNAARDGISTVQKGATVHVLAVESGGDLAALRIGDQSRFEGLRERLGKPGKGGTDDSEGSDDMPSGSSTTGAAASAV